MKNVFYSSYDSKFDCSPADTLDNESDLSEDRYVDYPVTEDVEAAEEFQVDPSFGVDEQAATYDFDGDFGSSDNGMNETPDTDLSELYEDPERADFETSSEFDEYDEYDVADPTDDGAVCVDPSDEMAATCDEHCSCGTTWAQEKCKLDDYEIISDVLSCEKQLVKLYSTALCESAEEPLRNVIRENLDECAADQFATFEFMQKRGMYQTEQADEQCIEQAKQQFCPLCD